MRFPQQYNIHGLKVDYVETDANLGALAEKLIKGLKGTKHHSGAMIVGASGTGKSRGAYEVFRYIKSMAAARLPDVDIVDYVAVPPPPSGRSGINDPKDGVAAGKHIVRELCKRLVRNPAGLSVTVADDVDLESLIPYVARRTQHGSGSGGRTNVLVVHIDEFQENEMGTIACLRAIRDCNVSLYYNKHDIHAKTLIIPILSGLVDRTVTSTLAQEGSISNFRMYDVELHYFRNLEQAWALMYAATIAATGCSERLKDLPPLTKSLPSRHDPPVLQTLRRLVEDTSGWPMALAQLGANVAVTLLLGVEGKPWLTPDWLSTIEQLVERQLHEKYSVTHFKSAFDTGLDKLLTLALSPHPVGVGAAGVGNRVWESCRRLRERAGCTLVSFSDPSLFFRIGSLNNRSA